MVGYYCPLETKSPIEYPCPKGKLGLQSSLSSENQCDPCEPGKYCEKPGSSEATGECSEGYKCPFLSNATSPTPKDYLCDRGYYCPAGTQEQGEVCPPGFYCPKQGMTPDDVDSTITTDYLVSLVSFTKSL